MPWLQGKRERQADIPCCRCPFAPCDIAAATTTCRLPAAGAPTATSSCHDCASAAAAARLRRTPARALGQQQRQQQQQQQRSQLRGQAAAAGATHTALCTQHGWAVGSRTSSQHARQSATAAAQHHSGRATHHARTCGLRLSAQRSLTSCLAPAGSTTAGCERRTHPPLFQPLPPRSQRTPLLLRSTVVADVSRLCIRARACGPAWSPSGSWSSSPRTPCRAVSRGTHACISRRTASRSSSLAALAGAGSAWCRASQSWRARARRRRYAQTGQRCWRCLCWACAATLAAGLTAA
jgi:hypothetical protein